MGWSTGKGKGSPGEALTCAPAAGSPAGGGCAAPRWQLCPSPALSPASPGTPPASRDMHQPLGILTPRAAPTAPLNKEGSHWNCLHLEHIFKTSFGPRFPRL